MKLKLQKLSIALACLVAWSAPLPWASAQPPALVDHSGQTLQPGLTPTTPSSQLRITRLPNDQLPALPAAPTDLLQPSDDQVLTLAAVEALALANHPALRGADGQVIAARGRWLQVGLPPNPEIGYSGSEIGNEGAAGQQGGFVSQEIVTAGKRGLSRAVASREVAAAEQRMARARLQVVLTARSYYFQALAAQRSVNLSRQLSAMADQAAKTSELRLQAEEISRASLLQSQIESESATMLEQQAANRHEAALRRLASMIGQSIEQQPLPPLEDRLQHPLPSLDWESTRAHMFAESPELIEAQFAVERARWAVERATAGRIPNVNLQAGVQYDNASNYTISNVQVSMPLPLFDRNQGAIAEACGELAVAQAALEQQQSTLEQRLANVLRDYLTARQRVNKYADTILPGTRQSLDMITQAYEQGELDYLQLLSAQRMYTEKHLAYLNDLETAWQKWAEIESLLVTPIIDAAQ